MHETPGWTTDWEILMSKCATDQAFREQLGQALAKDDDSGVTSLLEGIGIAGTTQAVRTERLAALKTAYRPMAHVVNSFGEHVRIAG